MTAKNFIKENFVLIAGLALPVLLVGFFFLAVTLPKSMVPPLKYSLLFSTETYNQAQPLPYVTSFFIGPDGRLRARLTKAQPGVYTSKKIVMYDAQSLSVREIPFTINLPTPEVVDNTEVLIPETEKYKLDGNTTSPDGYTFGSAEYGHGGLITDIFVGYRYNQDYYLRKDGAAYKIPDIGNTPYYYGSMNFIGWIVEDQKGQTP